MKLKLVLALSCTLLAGVTGCNRDRQEAAKLTNEALKEVALNPEGASSKLEQATKMDPTNQRIFYELAKAYKKKEEFDKMASALANATRLDPKNATYWFWRGWALEQQAKKKTISWEEAKEPYTKCIEADPNYADCYSQLGTVMLWTDDEQKAIENYTKAIEHEPKPVAEPKKPGDKPVSEKDKKKEEAAAAEPKESHIPYFTQLADLYIRLGYTKEAEQVLQEAKNFAEPNDKYLFGVHNLLALIYQDRGSQSEMIAELEAAKGSVAADSPEGVQILYSLGIAYAQSGQKKQEAIQMLKGFTARACKSAQATKYKTECESSQAAIQRLGGTGQ